MMYIVPLHTAHLRDERMQRFDTGLNPYNCCQDVRTTAFARREYEGKLSQRINVQTMQPLDFAADSRVLLSQIEKLTVQAA